MVHLHRSIRTKSKRFGTLLVFTGMLLGFYGCVTKSAPVNVPSHFQKSSITSEDLLENLLKKHKSVQSIKTIAKTTIELQGKKRTLKQTLIIDGESSLRMDTLNPFGQPIGVFIHHKEDLLLYQPSKGKVYKKKEVWKAMYRTFGTILDFQDILPVFKGTIPRLYEHFAISAKLLPGGRTYQLNTGSFLETDSHRIKIDATTLNPTQWVFTRNGQNLVVVNWSDYQEIKGESTKFPHKINIMRPGKEERFIVKFKNPQINPDVSDEDFKLFPKKKRKPEKSKPPEDAAPEEPASDEPVEESTVPIEPAEPSGSPEPDVESPDPADTGQLETEFPLDPGDYAPGVPVETGEIREQPEPPVLLEEEFTDSE